MNCLEARDLFSRYLENELDLKTKQIFDAHLAICTSCAKELAEFKEILASLKDTPEVEPPPYFLQAVHARLEKEPAFSRILKKLFVPFYIKIPMEAIAVTVTVIIVVVLVQKSQIGKITPIGMPAYTHYESYTQRTAAQEIRGTAPRPESTSQQLAFSEIHPREMVSQVAGADLQMRSQQQYGLSATESQAPAKLYSQGAVLAEKTQSLDYEAVPLKREYGEGKKEIAVVAALKVTSSPSFDLVKAKSITEKEIILKTQDLNQDIARLEVLLKDLGITYVEINYQPVKESFTFSILANQLDVLLSRLKDWQIISFPTKDTAVKEETALQPISVKLTLTTQ